MKSITNPEDGRVDTLVVVARENNRREVDHIYAPEPEVGGNRRERLVVVRLSHLELTMFMRKSF